MGPETVGSIFGQIIKAINFLDPAERRHVARALRIIYFYPDELLALLERLAAEEDPRKIIIEAAPYIKNEDEIQKEINFLTSKSVATNLGLSIEMVVKLREVASMKGGIRGGFNAIFFTLMLTGDKKEIAEIARNLISEINELNSKIREVDDQVRAIG
ncbi:hypothetical protein [Ancylobacter novellus]|uniref:hypothetical protein n=1 Tax=Ancylobacter novellus TaxID=921 RepID=UPI0011849D26|nr:hypothetical protein [Ancylobacter novellus]